MPSNRKAARTHRFSRAEVELRFDATINKTLGEIDIKGVLDGKQSNKGMAGAVFEQSVLGYPPDSRQEPDLEIDGVPTELKVTGLIESKRNRQGWRAKEPMSITAVSPDALVKEEFFTSAFWDKVEHLLIVYYLYVKPGEGVRYAQWATFEVKGYEFHEWDEVDIQRLKADWEMVQGFVRFALEHGREEWLPRLSTDINSQLLLIDTSPKYPNPPRFRFKNSFVTAIASAHFGGRRRESESVRSMRELEGCLARYAGLHAGKTLREIAYDLGVAIAESDKTGKSVVGQILVRMFTGRSGKVNSIPLFKKASIEFKSVVLTSRGGRTEDMKLEPSIDFDEVLNRDAVFEDTAFGSRFIDSSIVCAVFQEPVDNCELADVVFLGFKRLWLGVLEDEAKALWDSVRSLIFEGRLRDVPELKKDGSPRYTPKTNVPSTAPNWPKSRDGNLFLRGTGADAQDKCLVINGVRMYRQNIWVKGKWVVDHLREHDFLEIDGKA